MFDGNFFNYCVMSICCCCHQKADKRFVRFTGAKAHVKMPEIFGYLNYDYFHFKLQDNFIIYIKLLINT